MGRLGLRLLVIVPLLVMACDLLVPAPRRLSEADAGSLIELRRGERLEIALTGNPTTGYQWVVLEPAPGIVTQLGEPTFRPVSGAIGAGGTVRLLFEATAVGQAVLRLGYRRVFEPGVPPLRSFEVRLTVSER